MKLRGKIFIDGKIEALTGLNIGGSMTDIVIGGIDNSVIKTPEGVPYIPGSSLKGKMRALSELREGIKENPKKNKKRIRIYVTVENVIFVLYLELWPIIGKII